MSILFPAPRVSITAWLLFAMTWMLAGNAVADDATIELLWPQGAPRAKGTTDNDKPNVAITLPDPKSATGAAVVVCPGGGYGGLAMGHEGRDIAEWLRSQGIAAFVLKYRHRNMGYGHPTPMEDAQRAVRFARANAEKYKIDPRRIGVLGFSAGGHLASTVGTHFDQGDSNAKDSIDRVSCRPDFLILVYPVISLNTQYVHKGSRDNLLGPNPDPQLLASLSNETQVTRDTPPTFLVHTGGDAAVAAENSVLFYLALRKAGVPVEMHIYEKGGHGFGLAPNDPVLSTWPAHCIAWLKGRNFLSK